MIGSGLPIYTIRQAIEEAPEVGFDCHAHWIALNASAHDCLPSENALGKLLRYLYTDEVADGDTLLEAIDTQVRRNNGKEWILMLRDSISTAKEDAIIEGREQGLAQGHAEGLAEGKAAGLAEGQDRYAHLADALIDAGRLDDLKLANSDPEARERLFEEFGI